MPAHFPRTDSGCRGTARTTPSRAPASPLPIRLHLPVRRAGAGSLSSGAYSPPRCAATLPPLPLDPPQPPLAASWPAHTVAAHCCAANAATGTHLCTAGLRSLPGSASLARTPRWPPAKRL
eukprot:7390554-Prymnesium_polylepis.1